jgi:hypothetical protein
MGVFYFQVVLLNSSRAWPEGEQEDWGEPPPFLFVRLSFVESREKDKEKSHKGSNHGAALYL